MPRIQTSAFDTAHAIARQLKAGKFDPFQRNGLDYAGDCTSAVLIERDGRPDPLDSLLTPKWDRTILVDQWVRCRVCEACLRYRSRLWTARAVDEIRMSARTWFGTMTLNPAWHHVMLSRCRKSCASHGEDFDALCAEGQFQARHVEVSKELTKWLKRVRKESGVPLRYLLVVEAHKSGLPHYHILVHEVDPGHPVPARVLRHQWQLGFTKFKLVDTEGVQAARYVSKYLAKSALARVRASARYGDVAALLERTTKVVSAVVPPQGPNSGENPTVKNSHERREVL